MVKFKPAEKLFRQLLTLTSDDDKDVREVTLGAFEEIMKRHILGDRLLELSKDDDSIIREAALTLLKRIETDRSDDTHTLGAGSDEIRSGELHLTSVGLKSLETEELFLRLSTNPDAGSRLRALSLLRLTSRYGPYFIYLGNAAEYPPTYNKIRPQRTMQQKTTSPELERRVQARLLTLILDTDTAIRVKAAICYRERVGLSYGKVVLDVLIPFWLSHVTNTEEVPWDEWPWDDQRTKVCDIAYKELKLLAKLVPEAR
jgi:hypothetical protein